MSIWYLPRRLFSKSEGEAFCVRREERVVAVVAEEVVEPVGAEESAVVGAVALAERVEPAALWVGLWVVVERFRVGWAVVRHPRRHQPCGRGRSGCPSRV